LNTAIAELKYDKFIKSKIADYLTSDQHIDKMSFRLEELFFLQASGVPSTVNWRKLKVIGLLANEEYWFLIFRCTTLSTNCFAISPLAISAGIVC